MATLNLDWKNVDKASGGDSKLVTTFAAPHPAGVLRKGCCIMASVGPVVCIFGNDRNLLRSRSELLSSLGLCAFTAHTLCEAVELLELLGQTRCDLVLVCHSIRESEREVFMAYLLMNYPWIKFATVTPDDDRYSDHLLDKLIEVLGIGRPGRDYFLYQ